MAHAKEALVVILDISENSRGNFYDDEKSWCVEFLKKKILEDKKDEVAFILMGAEKTDNSLNVDLDGYENIIEAIPMQIANFDMLLTILGTLDQVKFVKDVDYLEATIVALDVLKREESKNFKQFKIVMFNSFSSDVDESLLESVIAGLKDLDVEIVIINNEVEYVDKPSTEGTITNGIFLQNPEEDTKRQKSKSLIKTIISECDGILCNFDASIPKALNVRKNKSRPWFWYCDLEIGSEISMKICVTIAIQEKKRFVWKTESVYPEANCWRATEYFKNGIKFEPEVEEIIKGYMLGSTPIPYDESSFMKTVPTDKSMKCIAFTSIDNIPPEYLCGKGTYLVLPRAGMKSSEKMLIALIHAMEKSKLVMIVRRVYNNGNRPKFIALLPNMSYNYPCLSLFELFCSEQYLQFDLPPLRVKATKPTSEQYSAIEDLIDAMNLGDTDDTNSNETRPLYQKDFISLQHLPNLTQDYICHLASQRVIQNVENFTGSLDERDKAFKVPDLLMAKASDAMTKIKDLFTLEEVQKNTRRDLIRKIGDIPAESSADDKINEETIDPPLSYNVLSSIGTIKPAEDYTALLLSTVENEDDDELRKANFDRLSNQMATTIYNLLFKSMIPQLDKIRKAIKTYRDQACFYNPYDYNDWIKEVKNVVMSRNMIDFWKDVIVKDELGLLWAKECDFFDDMDDKEPEKFYEIDEVNNVPESVTVEDDEDDLLNAM